MHTPYNNADKVFTWDIRIYYEDTDTGGIVYYANYLKFFERARTEWLRSLGLHQQHIAENEQCQFVVKNVTTNYRLPAKLDDALSITVEIEQIKKASIVFKQAAWRVADSTPVLLAEGVITIACVDTSSLRPKAIPETILQSMQEYL